MCPLALALILLLVAIALTTLAVLARARAQSALLPLVKGWRASTTRAPGPARATNWFNKTEEADEEALLEGYAVDVYDEAARANEICPRAMLAVRLARAGLALGPASARQDDAETAGSVASFDLDSNPGLAGGDASTVGSSVYDDDRQVSYETVPLLHEAMARADPRGSGAVAARDVPETAAPPPSPMCPHF